MTAPLGRPAGDTRAYTDYELALFARYRDQRASVRPLCCQGGPACWVELGPPGTVKDGRCRACHGLARYLPKEAPGGGSGLP